MTERVDSPADPPFTSQPTDRAELHTQTTMQPHITMALGIKVPELNVIEKEKATIRSRTKAMLSAWLKGRGHDPNWKTLCSALRDKIVARPDIATEIEKALIKQ